MNSIQDACYGVGICGAGGGGYVNCITKEENAKEIIESLMVKGGCNMNGIHFSYGTIDTEGIQFKCVFLFIILFRLMNYQIVVNIYEEINKILILTFFFHIF